MFGLAGQAVDVVAVVAVVEVEVEVEGGEVVVAVVAHLAGQPGAHFAEHLAGGFVVHCAE